MPLGNTQVIRIAPKQQPAPASQTAVKPVAKKPARVIRGPSVYYCPHCSTMLGTEPTRYCPHCRTSFPRAGEITFDQPVDVTKLTNLQVPAGNKTFRSPSGRLMRVQEDDLNEAIEEAIDQLVVVEEVVDTSKAKKAATFERWLTQASIPFEKNVKEDKWLLGTHITIEYYVEPAKHWLSPTQVFFLLRIPGGEYSTLRRHTSESVLARHDKLRSSNIYDAFRFVKYARGIYGDEPSK